MYNFKTVMGQSSYKSWSKWSPGDYLVGKFQSVGQDNFGKPNYKVEVIEASFKDGDEPKSGTIFAFNSSGALTKAMEEIHTDDVIKVLYKGQDTITKGKYKDKKFHSMDVLVASKDGSTKSTQSDDQELI